MRGETKLAASGRRRKEKAASVRAGGDAASSATLLAWYDRHRRSLPWRVEPGETADPYRVWLSEIMLQQTTTTAVKPFFERFLSAWPTVAELAGAPLEDVLRAWAGLGYYARARNLHACAKAIVSEHGSRFPDTEQGLRALPGIGPYTAAAIAAIAFGRHATPIDGNIERVIARLRAIETPLPAAKPVIRAAAEALTPADRAGDFAQAMMDLGATLCTPRRPACALCPWCDPCAARARGDQETFPRKSPKAARTLRRGAAFWVARADGHILVRTRPARGLLGGMTEIPGGEWSADFAIGDALRGAPPLPALEANGGDTGGWRLLPGVVTHVFTHFPLELAVFSIDVPRETPAPPGMRFVALEALHQEALPSLMLKVVAHAQDTPKRPLVRRAGNRR